MERAWRRPLVGRPETLQELALTPYYLDPAAYTKLWMDTEIRMKPILENLQQK